MAYVEIEKVLETARNGYHSDFGRSMADLTSLQEVLEDTPAADVVEVVRCGECKHKQELDKYEKRLYIEGCVACTQTSPSADRLVMLPTDFCSYGERSDT